MKTQINEIKRMQLLAGVINESQLNEKMSYDDFEQMIKPFLDLAKSKGWVWNSSGNSWYDIMSPGVALYHRTPLPTEETSIFKGKETIPGDIKGLDYVPNINYREPLESKSGDVIMQSAYDEYDGSAYFQSKDKAILDAIKSTLGNNMDVAKDISETSTTIVKQSSDGEGQGKPIFKPAKYYFMVLKKKSAAQPQQESFDQLDEIVDKVLAKLRSTK
jgi:hypothetical protein